MSEQTYALLDGATQEERIKLFIEGLEEGWAELDIMGELTFMRRVKTGERYLLLESDVLEMVRRGLIEPKSKN